MKNECVSKKQLEELNYWYSDVKVALRKKRNIKITFTKKKNVSLIKCINCGYWDMKELSNEYSTLTSELITVYKCPKCKKRKTLKIGKEDRENIVL